MQVSDTEEGPPAEGQLQENAAAGIVGHPSAGADIAEKQKKSPVWKIFIDKGKGKAMCKICKKVYSHAEHTTSNLMKHIKRIHKDTVMPKKSEQMSLADHGFLTAPRVSSIR